MKTLRNDVYLYGLWPALRYRLACCVRRLVPGRYWPQLAVWALYGRLER